MTKSQNNKYTLDPTHIKAFSGYFNDVNKLKKSASGGAATVFGEIVIECGGLVYGVTYADDFKSAHYLRAENKEQLNSLKGSKYIFAKPYLFDPSFNKKQVYVDVAENLVKNRIVLFIGTGCLVGGLKKYLDVKKVNDNNLFTIDLICAGATYSSAGKQFIEELESRYESQIIDFNARYKNDGWKPSIYARFQNGQVYCKRLFETEFGYVFDRISRASCFSCMFKGDNHLADITVGDYWGLEKSSPNYNNNGVSLILCRSDKSLQLTDKIDITIFPITKIDTTHALKNNSFFYRDRRMVRDYESIERVLKDKGLIFLISRYKYLDFLKFKYKNVLKRKLPPFVLSLIRKVRKII